MTARAGFRLARAVFCLVAVSKIAKFLQKERGATGITTVAPRVAGF
ncbi:MAG: hypothetical protein WBB98_08700 [Xanthobacteraceae bacterium]